MSQIRGNGKPRPVGTDHANEMPLKYDRENRFVSVYVAAAYKDSELDLGQARSVIE
jgi:hypothetical protein